MLFGVCSLSVFGLSLSNIGSSVSVFIVFQFLTNSSFFFLYFVLIFQIFLSPSMYLKAFSVVIICCSTSNFSLSSGTSFLIFVLE